MTQRGLPVNMSMGNAPLSFQFCLAFSRIMGLQWTLRIELAFPHSHPVLLTVEANRSSQRLRDCLGITLLEIGPGVLEPHFKFHRWKTKQNKNLPSMLSLVRSHLREAGLQTKDQETWGAHKFVSKTKSHPFPTSLPPEQWLRLPLAPLPQPPPPLPARPKSARLSNRCFFIHLQYLAQHSGDVSSDLRSLKSSWSDKTYDYTSSLQSQKVIRAPNPA